MTLSNILKKLFGKSFWNKLNMISAYYIFIEFFIIKNVKRLVILGESSISVTAIIFDSLYFL